MSRDYEYDNDDWISFHQSQIINQFPPEYHRGICYALCLEYARYISKDREGRETKDDDGTLKGFILKMERKFLGGENSGESNSNIIKRLEQYQGVQAFVKFKNTNITNLTNLVDKDDSVYELGLNWAGGGHSITVNKLKSGEYVIFDPNQGFKIANSKENFKSSLQEIIDEYKEYYSPDKDIAPSSTNFTNLIKEFQDRGDFINQEENNNQNAGNKTAKYLEPKKAAYAAFREKIINSPNIDLKDFSDIELEVLETKDSFGATLLHIAAELDKADVVKILLNKGADIEAQNNFGNTPLHIAALKGKAEIVQILLNKGADIEAQNNFGNTPLHIATKEGKADIVQTLLEQGSNPNEQNKEGLTPLTIAVKAGRADVVQILLNKEVDIEIKDKYGYTPLHIAAKEGKADIAQLLLDKEANINANNSCDRTPLHMAAEEGRSAMVKQLLEKEADIEARDNDGLTPLHYAVLIDNAEIVQILLEKGSDIEARGNDGLTPLHIALQEGRSAIVKQLLDKGADIDAKDEQGKTAMDYANFVNRKDIQEILKDHILKKQQQSEIPKVNDQTPRPPEPSEQEIARANNEQPRLPVKLAEQIRNYHQNKQNKHCPAPRTRRSESIQRE